MEKHRHEYTWSTGLLAGFCLVGFITTIYNVILVVEWIIRGLW